MEITNKGIYAIIERAAQSEPYIRQIRQSDFWLTESRDNEYPLLVVDIEGGDYTNYPRRRTFNIRLTLLDQRRQDNANFDDVTSNSRTVLEDIQVRLMQSPFTTDYGLRLLDAAPVTTIKHDLSSNDRLLGNVKQLTVSVPSNVCASQLPTLVGVPSLPAAECSPVVSNVFSSSGALLNSGSTSYPSQFSYTLPAIQWQNTSGAVVSLPSDYAASMEVDDITVVNSVTSQHIETAFSGTIHLHFSGLPSIMRVLNSNDDILYLNTNVAAGGTQSYEVDNCSFTLSAGNQQIYAVNIAAEQSAAYNLPDMTILNADGQSASTSYSGTVHTNFTGTGIIYSRPLYSSVLSINAGDEADNLSTGVYNYNPTGSVIQSLNYSAPDPYYVLSHLNVYSTYDRFTNSSGGTSFPAADFIVIDHLTGLAYIDADSVSNGSLATNVTEVSALSHGGFNDWRVATMSELAPLFSYTDAGWSSAFTQVNVTLSRGTSTAYPESADFRMITFATKAFSRAAKTTAYRVMAVRTHLY